jgi:DNA replication initiation complex subunit (GINS family)
MDNIKITLESLYDILRNEKKREELQLLEDTFFIDVLTYIRQKQAFLETKKENDDLFASGERDKLDYEIRSIKRILKEIYEKREKKIMDIALNRSRTGSDIIDTSSMLAEEKRFYETILKTLDQYRKGILLNLFKGELPSLIPEYQEEKKETFRKFEGAPAMVADEEPTVKDEPETPEETDLEEASTEEENSEGTNDSGEETKEESNQEMVKIKIVKPMPSFVWKDMKVYGPYDEGEEVNIFPEVADLMVRKGRAEKV